MKNVDAVTNNESVQVLPLALVARIRGEFLEMPGPRLTPAQAARFFGVSDWLARGLLETLARPGFSSVATTARTVDGRTDSFPGEADAGSWKARIIGRRARHAGGGSHRADP